MKSLAALADALLTIVIVGLIVSLVLSLLTSFPNHDKPCKTYAYYLPATFVICNLTETRTEFKSDQ